MIVFRMTLAFHCCWMALIVLESSSCLVESLAAPPRSTSDAFPPSNRRQVLQTASSVTAASFLGVATPSASASTRIKPIGTLSDGTPFPLCSFGLQIYNDETAYRLTLLALEVGYRNFFASVLAQNQKGFARAVKDSGIPRGDLFICGSVVSNRATNFANAYQDTTIGWKRNMEAFALGDIDYLDQIMLDYPGPDAPSIRGQWAAFQAMHEQKLTKTLAVSNFSPTQLDSILAAPPSTDFELTVRPLVNQLPFSVAYHPGDSIVTNTENRGILVQAWAPLGGSLQGRFSSDIKGKCAQIGRKYQKTFAQVALRWIVQTGAAFTTQSQNIEHFKQDLDIFDFELTPDEMDELSALA